MLQFAFGFAYVVSATYKFFPSILRVLTYIHSPREVEVEEDTHLPHLSSGQNARRAHSGTYSPPYFGLAVFKFLTKAVMLLMNTFCQNIT